MEFDAVESDQHQVHASPEQLGEENRYRLGRAIGKGGMGEVFLATDVRLNKQVALKLLSPILLDSEAARQRFKQECAICAVLESPHIVQVSDYGITAKGHPFYVMEYLQGETLSQRLARDQRLGLEQVSSLVRQICAGLQVAHSGVVLQDHDSQTSRLLKVIHRDLKPENIFLIPTGLGELVKIIDFGIAKIRSLQGNSDITQSLLGTSHYAAPEQFETAELDERTDIYSLGMILYEMLTGTDPYGLGFSTSSKNLLVSNTAWLTAHLTKTARPLRSQLGCGELPPAVEAVVLRCLAKSPAERFASVEALNQAFQSAVTANGPSGLEERVSGLPIQPQVQPCQTSSDLKTTDSAQINSRFRLGLDQLLRAASTEWIVLSMVTALAVIGLALKSREFISFLQPAPSLQSELKSKQLAKTLVGEAEIWSLAITGDGQTLLTGDDAGLIKVWNLRTGQVERTLISESGPIRSLALDADEQYLASGGERIQIWDLQTGLLRSNYAKSAWTVALTPDGQKLVSGSEDGQIRVWDLSTGQYRLLSESQVKVYEVAISSDQKMVVSGGQDRAVKVWDMQTGALLHTFAEHQDAVRSVALNSQNDLIASGSWDKTVKIWDLQKKTLVHTLEGHQDRVVAVAFSQDGQTLVSASRDRTIKLWDVQTGTLLQSLSGHKDWVLAVGISRDGRTVVSGSKDRTVRIWQ